MTIVGDLRGYHCVHPEAPHLLVTVEYLQKYTKTRKAKKFDEEGQRFLDSLRFEPPAPGE